VSGSVRLKGPLGTRHGGIRALRILPGRRVDLGLGSTRALGRGAYTATITLRQAGERTTLTRRFRVRG
jgi:hypothetical protein